MTLGEYLLFAAKRPWGWGTHDCCTFASQWAIIRGNPDPMAYLRGRYSTAGEAVRVLVKHGGLLAVTTRGMIEAGVPEADFPRAGDIGVVQRPTEEGLNQACGIYTGERWATLGLRGMDCGPAEILGLWRP